MPTHTDPCEDTIDLVRGIFARGYQAACVDMGAVVKTRPADTAKIEMIRDLVSRHVDVSRILELL